MFWLVEWNTESGDHGHYLYDYLPSDEFLDDFFRENHDEEFIGNDCYIYWDVIQLSLEE